MGLSHVMITGGAGFIGSHLADALVKLGHRVTVLDLLHPQVHGNQQRVPDYLSSKVQLIQGDILQPTVLDSVLDGVSIIFHFASLTGVSQSMYRIREYVNSNVLGLANLLQSLSKNRRDVRKLIIASSRAVYGEGLYLCRKCGRFAPSMRTVAQLKSGNWEIVCPVCGDEVSPIPTPEDKVLDPGSVYGITKMTQEMMALTIARTYGFSTVVMRFFNVYGLRQSFNNPHTGIIPRFANQLLRGHSPEVYEGGRIYRDFVHVSDVIRACLLAMEKDEADNQVFNVGTGRRLSLFEVASIMSEQMDGPPPKVTQKFRVGDVRHCYADLTKVRTVLSYKPKIKFEEGIQDYLGKIKGLYFEDNYY